MPSPRIVLVSGAPGSGKTTLGRHLADALSVPHVNKDRIREGLWLTDPSIARDGDRIWGIWMSSVRFLLAAGVSVVVDQTLYRGKSDADLLSQLLPLGRTVNVHTRSLLADSRWRAKLSDDPRWEPEQLRQLFAQAESNAALWTDPLDLCCPRIEVNTTDGYDPTIREVVDWIMAQP
jgi:tRNA uridine 5-carbamoylmethylation protein Kti12